MVPRWDGKPMARHVHSAHSGVSRITGGLIHRSDFANDLGGSSVQWTGSRKLGIALVPAQRGPSRHSFRQAQ